MSDSTGIFLILAACAAVLIIGLLRRRVMFFVRVAVRLIVGTIAIHVTNGLLASAGIGVAVGLNAISLTAVGTLGMGGFGMLYAILFYMNL